MVTEKSMALTLSLDIKYYKRRTTSNTIKKKGQVLKSVAKAESDSKDSSIKIPQQKEILNWRALASVGN